MAKVARGNRSQCLLPLENKFLRVAVGVLKKFFGFFSVLEDVTFRTIFTV
jgi:hypothetical protein